MAKYTLLDMVQKVLSATDSDSVNSIADTVESMQVVDIIEDAFYNMITNHQIPEHDKLAKLEPLSDADFPNYLKLPSRVTRVMSVRYDKSITAGELNYGEVHYLDPEEFLRRVISRHASDDNIQTVEDIANGVKLMIYNDRHPHYWTSFDDEHMVFDSFNNTQDSTLQAQKTMVVIKQLPGFTREDTFIPDIDDNLFPTLLNEAKSWAYVQHKQVAHPKAEQNARKQKTFYQKERHRLSAAEKNSGRDYGRGR